MPRKSGTDQLKLSCLALEVLKKSRPIRRYLRHISFLWNLMFLYGFLVSTTNMDKTLSDKW